MCVFGVGVGGGQQNETKRTYIYTYGSNTLKPRHTLASGGGGFTALRVCSLANHSSNLLFIRERWTGRKPKTLRDVSSSPVYFAPVH